MINKHSNVAFFIPHSGCKNQCSFCNQKVITGKVKQPTVDEIAKTLKDAKNLLKSRGKRAEIAYFGGSFTAIERSYMLSLLDVASSYLDGETFTGIRLSTRPDAIDDEILKILKTSGVSAIELGCQSMDDEVLLLNQRGHTVADVENASLLIKQYGFSLGQQMMTGLYGSSYEKDILTAKRIAKLQPDTVRIYPTVVMKGTKLYELYNNGSYIPPSFSDSVSLCAELLEFFDNNNISVIRLGLHSSEDLKLNMVAGTFHPAFREICESEIYFKKLKKALLDKNNFPINSSFNIYVNPIEVSKFIGQNKANVKRFKDLGLSVKVIADSKIMGKNFVISNRGT